MSQKINDNPTGIDPVNALWEGRYAPPPQDGEGRIWVRTCVLIRRDAEALYRMWRDVERAPSWQEQISQVTQTGETTSHWIMKSGDKTIEWNSEILADEPGRRISWQSIGGESENSGEVVFEASPGNRGTIVTVLQQFRLGKLTSLWETVVGRNPKQAVIENLRHFKALAETGEIPRTQGQSHGPRGAIASVKESMYGEKVPTPTGKKSKQQSA